MKQVWKWNLMGVFSKHEKATIKIPQESRLLCLQTQNNEPQLWALVDPSLPLVSRTFRAYGTGHDMPDNPGRYIGTSQMEDGRLVFHIFEL